MADAGGLVVLAADVTTSDDDNEAGNAFPPAGEAADPSNPALPVIPCHAHLW